MRDGARFMHIQQQQQQKQQQQQQQQQQHCHSFCHNYYHFTVLTEIIFSNKPTTPLPGFRLAFQHG